MIDTHPITPPPELVQQWRDLPEYTDGQQKVIMITLSKEKLLDIATQAARWGADTELEACINEIYKGVGLRHVDYSSNRESLCSDLRAARRPKPTLKQQALEALQRAEEGWRPIPDDCDTIRRALEALPDD